MSNYHKDDGAFSGGVFTALLIVLAFSAGYWIRDQGVIFKVQQQPTPEVQK